MKLHFLFIFLLISFSNGVCGESTTDSLLQVLANAVKQRHVAVERKTERITELRNMLVKKSKDPKSDLFPIYNALFQENRKFIYDSAFHYATQMIRTAHQQRDQERIGFARAQLGYILVSCGFFKEAFDTLLRVKVKYLPDSIKPSYYALVARAYYDLGDFDNDAFFKKYYFNAGHVYSDSARSIIDPGSYFDLYVSRIKNIKTGNFNAALEDANAIRALFSLDNESQAVNFYDLSHSYSGIQNREKAVEFLVYSALADLRAATKETAAMHALAKILYELGDIEYAYIFIQQAMEDATFYGARHRMTQISSILPLIASAKMHSIEEQRQRWLLSSVGLTVLVLVVVTFAFIIFKQVRRLRSAELAIKASNAELQTTNKSLSESNQIKEEYIGYYFNINAEYLNKIESFKKAIDQKIAARKFDDLKSIVDNINLKREREELSYSFDHVFLNLFPDFVSTVNSLFKPEDRIQLKEGQLLNTELRIFALIRMGINDPEKIAKVLGYSVNTIYAYKTRVKSKSIVPNDEFEKRIMEIRTA